MQGKLTDNEIKEVLNAINSKLETLGEHQDRFNEKFETYQKATQWVVQLAFSLIAAATVTVIVSSVLGR
ncbi:hypothetical protein L3556_00885 [Candidatus Synechococcus calcipolaris G9]|uniref:Hemolysin XhlA n=1 Tax=Candidatus Synechococcus calcipolaris G9 TaxID=1497997 RepID=A0ABT6EWK4_9SYNE|nr:hypothetical protein [Candidatus Synechococcus calcipolaris]MDG2989493.1 hypothetical protein [Candidatus Synechococcus calcipolaris G9]